MKKILFLLAVVVVLAGVFVFFQKGEKAIEAEIDNFVEANLNQPYHIQNLEQFPFIQEATLTLTSYKKDSARSLLRLVVVNTKRKITKQIDIPLESVITRGGSKHDGDSFGFAHIVTRPDLSGLRDKLPKQITDDSFTLEHFIDYDGSLRELYVVKPFDIQNKGTRVTLNGGQVRGDTSIFDRSAYKLLVQVEKMNFKEDGHTATIHPFTLDLDYESNGKYTGKSSVIEARFDGEKGLLRLSEGTYSGQRKQVEGLDMDLDAGQANFNLLEIKGDGFDVALENLEAEGGVYEAGNKFFDIRWGLAAKPKILVPAVLPAGADIQKVGLKYELKQLTAQMINSFQKAVWLNESVKNDSGAEKLLREVQQSAAELVFSVFLKEGKGQGEVKGKTVLSSYAKELALPDFSSASPEKLFDLQADFHLDKAVADVLNMTPLFQLQPQFFALEKNVFSSAVVVKDGIVKVNGQELNQ